MIARCVFKPSQGASFGTFRLKVAVRSFDNGGVCRYFKAKGFLKALIPASHRRGVPSDDFRLLAGCRKTVDLGACVHGRREAEQPDS